MVEIARPAEGTTADAVAHAQDGAGVALRLAPLAIAGLLLLAVVGWIVRLSFEAQGAFVYALDDAYIHLAIARQVVQSGTWGISPGEFVSATSSPAWTGAIAGLFSIVGVQEWVAFALALVAGFGLLAVAWLIARAADLRPLTTTLLLVALVIVTPLPALIFSGMEHAAHAAAVLGLAWLGTSVVLAPRPATIAGLLLLAPLAVALRYESLFVVGILLVLLLLRRRWLPAAGLLLASLLVPVGYGLWSLAQGGQFVPNPLLLKGARFDLAQLSGWIDMAGNAAFSTLLRAPDLLLLLIAAAVVFTLGVRRWGVWSRPALLLLVFAGSTLLQAQLAQVGWLFRYEAYLVALGLVALTVAASALDLGWRRWPRAQLLGAAALLVLLLTPLLIRGVLAAGQVPLAMTDRYVEHITMARFLQRYYTGKPVVLNDIGTTSFYTDVQVLDMYGLGSPEPVDYRREPGGYQRDHVARFADEHGADVAVLQVHWDKIHGRIPRDWLWVGDWELPRNVVFGTTLVGFFATNPLAAERLRGELRAFAADVPRSVVQSGPYTRP